MTRRLSLESLARELRNLADEHPVSALTPIHPRHRRDIEYGSCELRIQFRKEQMPGFGWIYHLSIGHLTGNRSRLPEHLLKQLRGAFFPDGGGIPMPSLMKNCFQFVGPAHE